MMNFDADYPHLLYGVIVGGTTENEFGQEETTVEETVFLCNCYEQVLGEAKEIRAANGEVKKFSSKIFLPIVTDIQDGEVIEVRDSKGNVRLRGEVKRNSHDDEEGSRLWV